MFTVSLIVYPQIVCMFAHLVYQPAVKLPMAPVTSPPPRHSSKTLAAMMDGEEETSSEDEDEDDLSQSINLYIFFV